MLETRDINSGYTTAFKPILVLDGDNKLLLYKLLNNYETCSEQCLHYRDSELLISTSAVSSVCVLSLATTPG